MILDEAWNSSYKSHARGTPFFCCIYETVSAYIMSATWKLLACCFITAGSFMSAQQSAPPSHGPETFGEVIDAVGAANPIQLSVQGGRALVAVSAKLQGRVL